jgi:hypothetical protein
MSDGEVIAQLTEEGTPLDAYFLLGEPGRQMVALWHPHNGVMACLIEDEGASRAYTRVLRKRGAREFQSAGEVYQAARREHWPNREKFKDA